MPLFLVVVLLLPLAIIVLIPVSIVQRLRRGTMRRQARGWVATANLIAVTLSMGIFLIGALITDRWAPDALRYTLGGLGAGAVLGLVGFMLTRWDRGGGRLHYTPNRWLVFAVTAIVSARVLYGFWRFWEGWRASIEQMSLVVASGLAMSMSAGAVVIGYYFVYWSAVRRRLRPVT